MFPAHPAFGPLVLAVLAALGLGCRASSATTNPGEPTAVPGPQLDAAAAPELELGLELGLADRYACMRKGGALQCWGKGVVLPDGDVGMIEGSIPMPLVGIDRFAIGADRVCTIVEGSLRCWGHDRDAITPALDPGDDVGLIEDVASVLEPVEVRIHGSTVCVQERSRQLVCWSYEEPMEPFHDEDDDDEEPPWMERHELLADVVAFDPGENFVCALIAGGRISCWGTDPVHTDRADRSQMECYESAECSDDDCSSEFDEYECDAAHHDARKAAWDDAVDIEGVPEPRAIASGEDFACALTQSGRVFCWGEGGFGQLGHGVTRSSLAAVRVVGIDDAVAIAAGSYHSCAVLGDGRVSCWGDDRYGTVGSDAVAAASPRVVPGIDGAVGVLLAQDLSCAVLRDGSARCWGRDTHQRVRSSPPSGFPAVPLRDVARLMPLGNDTCAARKDGSTWCWGRHEADSKLRASALVKPRPTPHEGLVELLPAGPCARTSASELRCWRSATEMHQGGPSTLVVAKVVAAHTSKTHACAVSEDGQPRCWPYVAGKAPAPVAVSMAGAAVDVAVGPHHGCAVRRDGAVECWRLDDPPSVPKLRLPALTDAVELAVADGQVCVRTKPGRVRCWKWDELDKPSFDHRLVDVEAIAAGQLHFCALTNGEVWCWGNNGAERLGSSTFGASSTGPQRVPNLQDVVEVAAGDEHTCARERDGDVRCWGRGSEGQLGRVPWELLSEPTPMRH